MNRPGRNTTAGRVYLDLQARAREECRPTDELFVLYVHERLLFRVAASPHRSRLILKGGMLLAALAERLAVLGARDGTVSTRSRRGESGARSGAWSRR